MLMLELDINQIVLTVWMMYQIVKYWMMVRIHKVRNLLNFYVK